jgi:Cdc6-like AAA superfamily ATPase
VVITVKGEQADSGSEFTLNYSKMTPGERRAAVGSIPLEDRLLYVRKMYVRYPQTEAILLRIAYIHDEAKQLPDEMEPENNLLVMGVQGAGKTRLITRYKRRFETRLVNVETSVGIAEVTQIPVLVATIPHRASDKAVVTELLRELGDPDPEDGSTEEQTSRLLDLLEKCGVELIILDEFQHIIDAESDKVLMKVANFLKRILKVSRKPLVLVGMPNSVRILDGNPQFNRLFTKRMHIEPLAWSDKEEQKCDLKRFLDQVDDLLPLPVRSQISCHDIAYKFYLATGGNIARVMKLVRKAAEFAINNEEDSITENHLYRAFNDQLKDQDGKIENPFLSCQNRRPKSTTPAKSNNGGGTNKRVSAARPEITGRDLLK